MSNSRSTEIAAAFSETPRIHLLRLLREGERCVGDLVASTGIPQPTVSRHLAHLLRARLVQVRTDGLHRFYRLAPVDHPLQECLLGCLGRCLAGSGVGGVECSPGRRAHAHSEVDWGAARTRVKISG